MNRILLLVGPALAAVLLAVGLAAPASAQGPPTPSDFELREPQPDYMAAVRELDADLNKSGVQKLLDEANRNATTGDCNGLPGDAHEFCFQGDNGSEGDDQNTQHWYPQGVTTVSDAVADELWGSKKPVLASWYNKTGTKGIRVSFLDPTTKKYRHVLLAVPGFSEGDPTFRPLVDGDHSIHAGGIAWYGKNLYVADTHGGLRVFSMDYIFDIKDSPKGNIDDKEHIGSYDPWFGDQYYASYGYRYVMPQVDAYVNTDQGGACGSGGPRFSYIGLDRSTRPDRLVTGEYCNGSHDNNGRVMTWDLDASTGKIKADSDGRYRADEAFRIDDDCGLEKGCRRIQGAVSHDGSWYLTQTNTDPSDRVGPRLFRAKPNAETGVLEIVGHTDTGTAPEDLSFYNSSGYLWTLGEKPGSRAIFSQKPPS